MYLFCYHDRDLYKVTRFPFQNFFIHSLIYFLQGPQLNLSFHDFEIKVSYDIIDSYALGIFVIT
jgi:hypothetical protein